ncbi:MAG: polysaccharide biosynthesis/export family protein [Bacillota bacterium]|nr:polysaccharide biosynthesis/export family protein [Bacillota bacterium]
MFPRVRSTLVLAGLLALTPLHAPAQQEQEYFLRPGDRLTIEVFTSAGVKVDVVAGERVLDRNGDIYLPYVGTVRAAGLDHNSLREHLVQVYGVFYAEPVVNVKAQLQVSVTGAVPRPGRYYLDPTATLVDALAEAGGPNIEYAVTGSQIPADPREVQLVREGLRQSLNFHPNDITEELLQMRIRSGDWIHVPSQDRTRIRDEVMFWGSLLSLASSIVGVVILIGR